MKKHQKIAFILKEVLLQAFGIRLIQTFLENLFEYEHDSLISKEAAEILSDPIKREKLNLFVDKYKETGVWDYSVMD